MQVHFIDLGLTVLFLIHTYMYVADTLPL